MQKQLYVITQTKVNDSDEFFDVYKFSAMANDDPLSEAALILAQANFNQFNISIEGLTDSALLREGMADDAVLSTVHSEIDGSTRKTYIKTLRDHPLQLADPALDLYLEHLAYNAEKSITMTAEFMDCDDAWNPL